MLGSPPTHLNEFHELFRTGAASTAVSDMHIEASSSDIQEIYYTVYMYNKDAMQNQRE